MHASIMFEASHCTLQVSAESMHQVHLNSRLVTTGTESLCLRLYLQNVTASRKIGHDAGEILPTAPNIESSKFHGDWKRHRRARALNVFIPQASVIH